MRRLKLHWHAAHHVRFFSRLYLKKEKQVIFDPEIKSSGLLGGHETKILQKHVAYKPHTVSRLHLKIEWWGLFDPERKITVDYFRNTKRKYYRHSAHHEMICQNHILILHWNNKINVFIYLIVFKMFRMQETILCKKFPTFCGWEATAETLCVAPWHCLSSIVQWKH